MRTQSFVLTLFMLAPVLPACATETASTAQSAGNAELETEEQKILYVLGMILAQDIGNAGFSDEEMDSVLLGVRDSALGLESQVDIDAYGPQLNAFMQERIESAAGAELTEALAFVELQANMDGATVTASGIVIQEMTAGTGASPAATDTVQVHYHGTLRDGTVFDSSVDRNEPATFPLNQVIPCWTEGLQTIKVGGTSRLVCPPDLAYGPGGRPGIPGNAALMFEVELLDIVE